MAAPAIVATEPVCDPPIFFVGLPRSGITLWSKTLVDHPHIARFPEMHYLTPWHPDIRHLLRELGGLSKDRNVEQLVERLFSPEGVKGLARGYLFWKSLAQLRSRGLPEAIKERLLASRHRDLGTVFRCVIEEATRCRGRIRAAVRFPVYPAYAHLLFTWWPEAFVIHISRDPRAFAASKSNDPGGTGRAIARFPLLKQPLRLQGMSFAVLQYIWAAHVHTRLEGRPNYSLFQYEDLVSAPEKTLRDLCRFCGLPFVPEMLAPPAGQPSSITGLAASGFDPARIYAWRNALSPLQRQLITRLTQQSMRRFRYNPDRYFRCSVDTPLRRDNNET